MTILRRSIAAMALGGALTTGVAVPAAATPLPEGARPHAFVADADDRDLIAVDPARVHVDVPAPGHEESWTMTARNVSGDTVGLGLEAVGANGDLFAGGHPLQVTVRDPSGAVVLGADDLQDGSELVALPALPAGGEYIVTGTAVMPGEAGDEYRAADGGLTLRFVATADEAGVVPDPAPANPVAPTTPGATPPGRLAITGSEAVTVVAIAIAVIGAGTTIRAIARRRRTA